MLVPNSFTFSLEFKLLNHGGGRLLVPNSKLLLDIHIKRRWSNVGTKLDLHFQVFNQGGRLLVPNYKLILDFKENISLWYECLLYINSGFGWLDF